MKKKITKKEVLSTHQHVLKVGDCLLQTILNYKLPYAYTSGVYGWNSDVYSMGNVAISMGRAPFGDIKVSYDLACKYEEIAITEIKKYHSNAIVGFERLNEILTDLLHSFVEEAIATDGKGYADYTAKSHYQFN